MNQQTTDSSLPPEHPVVCPFAQGYPLTANTVIRSQQRSFGATRIIFYSAPFDGAQGAIEIGVRSRAQQSVFDDRARLVTAPIGEAQVIGSYVCKAGPDRSECGEGCATATITVGHDSI